MLGEKRECKICEELFNIYDIFSFDCCDNNICIGCIEKFCKNINTCPVNFT
jgi:hypothetical protein